MMEPRLSHWTAAGVTALALHAGLALFFLSGPDDGARAPGLGGVSVAMTMVAARAGAEADAREQTALTPTQVTPQTVAEVAAPPPDASEPEPPTVAETVQAFDPLPAVAPDSVIATPATPVDAAQPLPVPERRPKRPPSEAPAAKPTPTAQPVTPSTDKTAVDKKAAAADHQQEASRAASASQGRRDDGRKGASADDRDALGGGPVGKPAPNYVNMLRYWLERHKTYPKDARRHRMQGIVHLYFRVTRDGRVLRHEIRKTSGHPLLDGEAEAMLARAQPLPEFTDDMSGGYLDVVVPVLFSLRGNS
jgi:protein TonB